MAMHCVLEVRQGVEKCKLPALVHGRSHVMYIVDLLYTVSYGSTLYVVDLLYTVSYGSTLYVVDLLYTVSYGSTLYVVDLLYTVSYGSTLYVVDLLYTVSYGCTCVLYMYYGQFFSLDPGHPGNRTVYAPEYNLQNAIHALLHQNFKSLLTIWTDCLSVCGFLLLETSLISLRAYHIQPVYHHQRAWRICFL